MGNCSSSEDMKKDMGQDAKRVQAPRPVKRELKDVFEEKKGEGVKEVLIPELAANDSEEELFKTEPQIAAPDAVADAAVVADEPESLGYRGLIALRSISPRCRGLLLLYAAVPSVETQEEAAEDEAEAAGDAGATQENAVPEELRAASVDVVDDEAEAVTHDTPKESFSRKLAVDTDAELQGADASARELQSDSVNSPSSPAAWVPDDSTKTCQCCGSNFTFARRRHHCRGCGHVVCNSCSTARKVMPNMGHSNPVRCCVTCA